MFHPSNPYLFRFRPNPRTTINAPKMTSFLHVRRPTTYSKLEQSIPKPPEACPAFGGLPQWEKLPLDRKLPANACPVHPPAFRRGKLSEHLWAKPHDLREFDLSDPLGHDVSYGYMPLHDKHLREHFEVEAFKDVRCEIWGLKFWGIFFF